MVTGELRNQIDRLWDAFWSGGISNTLEVIEQITYLLFLRRLDELQILEEQKARTLNIPIERHIPQRAKTTRNAHTPISAGRGSRTSRRVTSTS
jgi:type I restriction enzyme M protein